MPVLETGIGPMYLQLYARKVVRWLSCPETTAYMNERYTTPLKGIGQKVSRSLPIILGSPEKKSGPNVTAIVRNKLWHTQHIQWFVRIVEVLRQLTPE